MRKRAASYLWLDLAFGDGAKGSPRCQFKFKSKEGTHETQNRSVEWGQGTNPVLSNAALCIEVGERVPATEKTYRTLK